MKRLVPYILSVFLFFPDANAAVRYAGEQHEQALENHIRDLEELRRDIRTTLMENMAHADHLQSRHHLEDALASLKISRHLAEHLKTLDEMKNKALKKHPLKAPDRDIIKQDEEMLDQLDQRTRALSTHAGISRIAPYY